MTDDPSGPVPVPSSVDPPPVASRDDPGIEIGWVGTYRIFDAVDGGITMERVLPDADSAGHLYEFTASDEKTAGCVFSAFQAGMDCRAESREDPRDAFILPRSGFTPFWVFSGAMWISFSVIALSFAWFCVRSLVFEGSSPLFGG